MGDENDEHFVTFVYQRSLVAHLLLDRQNRLHPLDNLALLVLICQR